MRPALRKIAGLTLAFVFLILAACAPPQTLSAQEAAMAATQTFVPLPACEACAQATLAALQAQEKIGADAQAGATAEVMRANAQETLNAASSTLSAAQTQAQNSANIIAAQIAATAEFQRANAQATLNSAGSTQSAALTQDAIQQTQMAGLATAGAGVAATQQNQNALAANTQTAVANNIATQTQAALATSQWYADQDRQRDEQRAIPINFLWMWCFPTFLVLLAVLFLWGGWRWLKIQQARQRLPEMPVGRLPAPVIEVVPHQHDDSLPYIESDVIDDTYQSAQSDDQIRLWLDEVKRKLLRGDRKDQDDTSN
jgi:hypothetical protein